MEFRFMVIARTPSPLTIRHSFLIDKSGSRVLCTCRVVVLFWLAGDLNSGENL